MRHAMNRSLTLFSLALIATMLHACGGRDPNTVVVYTALDEI
jgi:hypothetical protein